jgi:dihydroflavonol-4-reductase
VRVFVTGGNGFIGSRVIRRLCERGHDVRCLLRPSASTRRIRGLPFETLLGDMHDRGVLASGLADREACVHMASVSSWDEMARVDIEHSVVGGTRAVVDAARPCASMRMVYVSSAAAINASHAPQVFDEGSPFGLADSGLRYAVAKHVAESVVLDAAAKGLDAVVVNPSETYGPEDDEWVTAGAIRDTLRGWPALAVRGGASVAHVEDVAAGIVAALERGRTGERYILGGDNVTIEQIVRLSLTTAGIRRRPVVVVRPAVVRAAVHACRAVRMAPPVPPGLVDYLGRYWYVDSSKARRELGYESRPCEETIRSVVDWIQGAEPAPRMQEARA